MANGVEIILEALFEEPSKEQWGLFNKLQKMSNVVSWKIFIFVAWNRI